MQVVVLIVSVITALAVAGAWILASLREQRRRRALVDLDRSLVERDGAGVDVAASVARSRSGRHPAAGRAAAPSPSRRSRSARSWTPP